MKSLATLLTLTILAVSGSAFSASTHDGYIIKSKAIATDTVSITSDAVSLANANGVAYNKLSIDTRLASGGAATGSVVTYLSNDMVGDARFATNWVLYNSTAITAGGQILSNFTDVAAKWLKVVFLKSTNAAATGTVSTIIYVP